MTEGYGSLSHHLQRRKWLDEMQLIETHLGLSLRETNSVQLGDHAGWKEQYDHLSLCEPSGLLGTCAIVQVRLGWHKCTVGQMVKVRKKDITNYTLGIADVPCDDGNDL